MCPPSPARLQDVGLELPPEANDLKWEAELGADRRRWHVVITKP